MYLVLAIQNIFLQIVSSYIETTFIIFASYCSHSVHIFSAKPEVVNPIDVKDPVDEKDSAIPRNFRKLFAEEKTTAQVNLKPVI